MIINEIAKQNHVFGTTFNMFYHIFGTTFNMFYHIFGTTSPYIALLFCGAFRWCGG